MPKLQKMSKEQRQKKRGVISVPVSFEDPSGVTKKVIKGTTADLSSSGLGIYSDIELKPDTVLEIECQDIWDAPMKFTVQWCNRVKHNFYRIGLEVTEKS